MLERGDELGHFRILGVLGRGATATVYEALDVSVERRVALKVLSPELSADPAFSGRFRREAKLQASLEHPHITTVYEAAESEHGLYIAMRLIEGPTLATLIARHSLGADRALHVLTDVAAALDAAHEAGLVHRDVKPQNVLIDRADSAYLSDFGLTKLGVDHGLTVSGGIVGTLAYLAPEVIRGAQASPESDVYAFAAMLFESLTGRLVFDRGSEAAMLYAHTSEPPPAISSVRPALPRSLDPVLERALAKDPDQRPESARELVEQVHEAIAPKLRELEPPLVPAFAAVTVQPAANATAAGRPRRRAFAAASAALGAAVAVAVLALAGAFSSSSASAGPYRPQTPGAILLGSTLGASGRPVGCTGIPGSNCSLAQTALPGGLLRSARGGVIRRWSVRDARGELALQVLTQQGGGLHQVERSQSVFVPDVRTHSFATDLDLDPGDFVAVEPVAGAQLGVRMGVRGARLIRWQAPVSGGVTPHQGASTLQDDELLLALDFVPGGTVSQPPGTFGSAAASLGGGAVLASRSFRYNDRQSAHLKLTSLPQRVALDEFRSGRRVARITVPGLLPGGRSITFLVDHSPSSPAEVGIYIEYVNADSQFLVTHYFLVHPSDFVYLN